MNLLAESWIPVQRASGRYDLIAPHQITETDDPPQRLAATRPDFNGSLIQFLIGLLQTSTAVDENRGWRQAFQTVPTPAQLQAQFAPLAGAFEFDGDGARFMQDLTLGADEGEEKLVSALLIEAPGAQSIERNVDHFVKRGVVERICPACAAAALFTLQTNAPSGGAGHRTSLRGGGPLTTLVIDTPSGSETGARPALWRDIWMNVRPKPLFHADSGDASLTEPARTFPWLVNIDQLQPGEETQPVHAHPAQMFWAMPRRIRLDFSNPQGGACDLCARASERLLSRYRTKNYGMNYKGAWRHPLSPYYRLKEGEPELPLHPQPGGLGYRHWLAWILGNSEAKKQITPASVVTRFLHEVQGRDQYRLWAFGYDMDNMKARCWYESTLPLYPVDLADDSRPGEKCRKRLQGAIGRLVAAAELVVYYVRSAIRSAWFGDAEVKGDLSFVDAAFWSATEDGFYVLLSQWIELVRSSTEDDADDRPKAIAGQWLDALREAARGLFREHAESAPIGASDPRRIAEAHRRLIQSLYGAKLDETLGLETTEKKLGKSAGKAGRRKKEKTA